MNPIERALARADKITAANTALEQQSRELVIYVITLATPRGVFEVEVPTFLGAKAAARRAHFTLVAKGYGDIDQVTVTSTTTKETP